MVISLVHPHTCGFAKAAIWHFTKDVTEKIKRNDNETPYQHRVRSVQIIHERFGLTFTNKKFSVDFKTLQRKLPDLRKKFTTWNLRKKKEREQYLEAFLADNWKALSVEQKAEHSLMDRRGCFHRYSVYQSFFPVQSKKFQGCLEENPRIRRKKLRGQGGEITVATPQSIDSVKAELRGKILLGEYSVGQQIAPRKYEKMVLNDNGEIVKTEFVVEGRKQPLIEIRERTLKNQEKFMRHRADDEYGIMTHESVTTLLKAIDEYNEGESLKSMQNRLKDIERTRHIRIRHDLSTIANHGHLVFMVSSLYDPAVHYTNAEYQNLTGCKKVDVQTKVETPEVYIVARSGSSDVEQLTYIDTRLECLEDLSVKLQTNAGNVVNDIMRFFHGDSPARQLESGQQKGGNFYCSGCGAKAQQAYDLDICFSCHYLSLTERQQLVLLDPWEEKILWQKFPSHSKI
ncbi:Hypothetical predicted protein [Paramuricea clavata]|uniref:Uncharacterized protein n=1 Tax=Paramuricea clavata TaxID=317549 RepID=A0A6S7GUV1_PARCT|nr:Hypothetical predicted protein [Paramuricea clavata]